MMIDCCRRSSMVKIGDWQNTATSGVVPNNRQPHAHVHVGDRRAEYEL